MYFFLLRYVLVQQDNIPMWESHIWVSYLIDKIDKSSVSGVSIEMVYCRYIYSTERKFLLNDHKKNF